MLSSFFCSSVWICCCVRSRWCQSASDDDDHGAVGAAVADRAEDVGHLARLLVGRQHLLDPLRQLRHVVEVAALLRGEADLDDAAILRRRDLLLQRLEGDETERAEAEAERRRRSSAAAGTLRRCPCRDCVRPLPMRPIRLLSSWPSSPVPNFEASIGQTVSATSGGDADRERQHEAELGEQAADHARHERDRDEHGGERRRRRQHGEHDLAWCRARRRRAARRPWRGGGRCSR